jgi:NADH-ubiquinone oxidoreductase chain 5
LDILYNNYLISGGLKVGYTVSKILDKGFIELIGPFGLTTGSYSASQSLSKLDTGVITTYALYITLGLISILFILFTPLFLDAFTSIGQPTSDIIYLYTSGVKILLLSVFAVFILLGIANNN